ncbi:MAG: helix-turn-helix transcriptional regulator [Candidatus Azobacteroides sp.]|nr:helix-turn-helix transcriptional regulator [Candidatus Azobacteroides sp.]
MQTTKDRLIEFIKYKRLSQAKFAGDIGVSRNYVNSMTENPTQDTLNKIKEKFPELNIDWLTKGTGDMLQYVEQRNINGNNIQGQNVTVNKSQIDIFLELLKNKDDQLNKSQEQIDRLIGIIERTNN